MDQEQSIGIATGIDYSIAPLILSYKRGVNAFNRPLPSTVGIDLSVPLYSFDVSDIRIRLLTEMTLLKSIPPLNPILPKRTRVMTFVKKDATIRTTNAYTKLAKQWSISACLLQKPRVKIQYFYEVVY